MSYAINLMTPTARRREVYRSRLRLWLTVAGAMLLLLTMVTAAHYWFVRQTYLEQQRLETTIEPINHLKEANKQLTKQIAAIRDEEQFVIALSSRNPTVTLLGMLGSAVAEIGDHVFLERIQLSSPERISNTQINSPIVVDIAGMANNKTAAGQVADELQTSIPSSKVDVTANKETRIKNHMVHDFTLHGTFQN